MRVLRSWHGTLASALIVLGLASAPPVAQAAPATAPDRAIAHYQRLIRLRPSDARLWARLGDTYIQKARESGDVDYFERAEQALRQALAIDARYSDAVRHLAFVLYSRHDFEGAAREAQRAIELNAADAHAYGILGDAYLEVGKYEHARETYRKMIQLQGDLYSYSRRAGLRNLTGDAEGAIDDLKRAIEAGRGSGQPRESLAWAQWQLGSDYFALGNLSAAEAQYLEALKTYPNYYRASAGLAQVRAAQGEYAEAIELYQRALGVIPMPEYAAALGDVYATIGRHEEASRQYALVEYIGRLSTLNKVLYNRELAYFYADHDVKLPEALELAEKELEVRRDVYAYDLLAWTLYKNGRAAEAVSPITSALSRGIKDAKLHFHAGLIHQAVGQTELARDHLRRALALNPRFHVLHAAVARRTLKALDEGRP